MTFVTDMVIAEAPLPRPLSTARGTWTSRRGVLLLLRDADGRVGRGEATPLPGYSPDDVDDCIRALQGEGDLGALPAARFARETALADLAAQQAGINVASYLAGEPVTRTVPRAGLIDLASPSLEDDARELVRCEVHTLKAKIGARPLADDLASLARVRRVVGPSVRLRLDANGAFDLEGARAALERLASVEPELVEEPTRGEALLWLGPCAVPWAADESLQEPAVALGLLDSPCAAYVIKPQLYGLHAARELALRAQARKKRVIVSHLFDGPVGLAAACELAVSLPEPPMACGLDVHAGLLLFGAMRVPQLDRPGLVVSHQGAGLGVA